MGSAWWRLVNDSATTLSLFLMWLFSWHAAVAASQFAAGSLSWWSAKRYGDLSLRGPIYGIVSQAMWFVAIAITPIWGMAPWAALFMLTHIRNLRKWLRERPAT